jgi:hypothetical protein
MRASYIRCHYDDDVRRFIQEQHAWLDLFYVMMRTSYIRCHYDDDVRRFIQEQHA